MAGSPPNRIRDTRVKVSHSDLAIIAACHSQSPAARCFNGLPTPAFLLSNTVEQFIVWRPWALPRGTSVSISSSRLSQKLEQHTDWFDALRTIAVRISKEQKFLITAKGTATDDFVRRIADLFRVPVVVFEPFPKAPSLDWFKRVTDKADQSVAVQENASALDRATRSNIPARIFFKILDTVVAKERPPNINDLLIESAATSIVLSVRKGGNIERAVERRLIHAEKPATRLLINRRLTAKSVEESLVEQGATAWWLCGQAKPNPPAVSPTVRPRNCALLSPVEIVADNFLIHCTRRRVGPWPDQSKPEFLDDLIFQAERSNHSQVASLCRILASQRILASCDLTRDPRPVVCFSDIPMTQISQQRVFRPHISRWDFESYGLAIDRVLLEEIGARQVAYGREQDWDDLPEEHRPFFQIEKSKSKKIVWRLEHEWRLLGDLNLEQIPADRAVVFVKTESDAQLVDNLSRWPIVVLSTGS